METTLGPRQSKPVVDILKALSEEGRTSNELIGVRGVNEQTFSVYSPFGVPRTDVTKVIAELRATWEPITKPKLEPFLQEAKLRLEQLRKARPLLDKRRDPEPEPTPEPAPAPKAASPAAYVRDKYAGIRKHKLLPKEIERRLPKLYSQEKVADPVVQVKFFSPYSQHTWYAVEGEPDGEDFWFFGYVVGDEKEWGYFSLDEMEMAYDAPRLQLRGGGPNLAGVKVPLVERDCWFKPQPISKLEPAAVASRTPEPPKRAASSAPAREPDTTPSSPAPTREADTTPVALSGNLLADAWRLLEIAVRHHPDLLNQCDFEPFPQLREKVFAQFGLKTPAGEVKTTPTPAAPADTGVSVTRNAAKNGIELRFSARPSQATLDTLKARGWRWSKFSKCWYIRTTPDELAFAQRIAGSEPVTASAPPSSAMHEDYACSDAAYEARCEEMVNR